MTPGSTTATRSCSFTSMIRRMRSVDSTMPPRTAQRTARHAAAGAARRDRDAVLGRQPKHKLDLRARFAQHGRVGREDAQARLVAAVDLERVGRAHHALPTQLPRQQLVDISQGALPLSQRSASG